MDKEIKIIKGFASRFYDYDDNPLWFGDDSWVSEPDEDGNVRLITCDNFLEKIHFSLDYFTPQDIGIKSVNATASDIAAMGGIPEYLAFCISIPPYLDIDFLDGVADGMSGAVGEIGIKVVAGDTCATRDLLGISVFVTGRMKYDNVLRRRGTEPGEILAVTGVLGNSWVGRLFLNGVIEELPPEDRDIAISSHLNPTPRIDVGRTLADSGLVTTCSDLSDSLSRQAHLISMINGVGVDIDFQAIPLSDISMNALDELEVTKKELGLGCGEDFELLFTLKEKDYEELHSMIYEEHSVEIARIGSIVEGDSVYLVDGDDREEVSVIGYEHFTNLE